MKTLLLYLATAIAEIVVDRSHALLETLEGQRLTGIIHVNRLKMAYLRTDAGTISNIKDLNKEAHKQVGNKDAKHKNNRAAAILLETDQPDQLRASANATNRAYEISRARIKNGSLQVLVQLDTQGQTTWIDLSTHPRYAELQSKILDNDHIKVSGSTEYFALSFL